MKNLLLKRYIQALIVLLFFVANETFAQINALDYTLQKRRKAEKFESNHIKDHLFLSGAIGAEYLKNDNSSGLSNAIGPKASLYVGTWFTPVIGMRVGVEGAYLPTGNVSRIVSLGLDADYLMNISAFAAGYNPERLFDVIAIAGVNYHSSLKTGKIRHIPGANIGLQGKFNLSPLVDFFIEPKLSVYGDKIDYSTQWRQYNLAGSLMAGVTYKMVPDKQRASLSLFGKGAFEHLFISGGIGAQMLLSRRVVDMSVKNWLGPAARLSIGTWFNPVSGLRLSAEGGASKWIESNYGKSRYLKTVGGSLDYLLNLNSAFGGYNKERKFELIGVAGVDLVYGVKNGDKNIVPGIGAGLQGSLRLNRNLDLFIEPELTMYHKHLAGETSSRFDLLGNVYVGLTYNREESALRNNKGKFVKNSFFDNMFISLSGGGGVLVSNPMLSMSTVDRLSPMATVSVGKWFTPVSGLRLSGSMIGLSTLNKKKQLIHEAVAGGEVDYLLNLSSWLSGYYPERKFEISAFAGPSLMLRSQKIYPVVNAGLIGSWNITPSWALYLEPKIGWTPNRKGFNDALATYQMVFASASLGVSYRFVGYDKASYHAEFEKSDSRKFFVSLAGGFSSYFDTRLVRAGVKDQIGGIGRASLGRWYTPLSAWRVSVSGGAVPSYGTSQTTFGDLSLDYMVNLNTLFAGYKPRLFDVNAAAGVHAALSLNKGKFNVTPGISASLQGLFNITSGFGLYIEPQLVGYLGKFDGKRKVNPVSSVLLGINYKPKSPQGQRKNMSVDNPNFISLSIGSGAYAMSMVRSDYSAADKMMFDAEVSVGRWINSVNGLRLTFASSSTKVGGRYNIDKGFNLTMLGLRADYLLNLTQLISRDVDSRFNMSGIIGGGVAFPKGKAEGETTYNFTAGAQFSIKVLPYLDLYAEPRISVWGDKIDRQVSPAKFDADGRILIGASYRF